MKSLKMNIGYNFLFRSISFIISLITSPYIARVLGADKVGIFSYTNAIAYYFFLFSMLGINSYGNREIAKVKDDRKRISDAFWQIYYLQFFLSVILTAIYIIIIIVLQPEYFTISLIQALYVFSATTDINWFAYGVGEFKIATIRSIMMKIIMAISLFLFVKNGNDLWVYTLIVQGGNIISLLVIWPLVFKYTSWEKPDVRKILSHLKPDLLLFLPYIAMSLYQYMDKIMLGIMQNETEVGYYNYAENILSIPLMLSASIGTVMLPYMSNLNVKRDRTYSIKIVEKFLYSVSWVNIALAFGMAAVSTTFIPWYLGDDFYKTSILLQVLSSVVFFSGFGEIVRTQLLIPQERDTQYVSSIFIGALVNFIMNLIMIPYFSSMGASIATTLTYIVVMIIQCFFSRKEIKYSNIFMRLVPYMIMGFIMFLSVTFVSKFAVPNILLKLIIEVVIGFSVYMLLSMLWMSKVDKESPVMNMIRKVSNSLEK